MSEHLNILESVVERVRQEPGSAAALTLYAMVNTMEYERAGCLFKLNKLRDLGPEDRQLAYGLMEAMIAGMNREEVWVQARMRMDEAIRAS